MNHLDLPPFWVKKPRFHRALRGADVRAGLRARAEAFEALLEVLGRAARPFRTP